MLAEAAIGPASTCCFDSGTQPVCRLVAGLREVLRPGGLLVVDNATPTPKKWRPSWPGWWPRAGPRHSFQGNGEFLAAPPLRDAVAGIRRRTPLAAGPGFSRPSPAAVTACASTAELRSSGRLPHVVPGTPVRRQRGWTRKKPSSAPWPAAICCGFSTSQPGGLAGRTVASTARGASSPEMPGKAGYDRGHPPPPASISPAKTGPPGGHRPPARSWPTPNASSPIRSPAKSAAARITATSPPSEPAFLEICRRRAARYSGGSPCIPDEPWIIGFFLWPLRVFAFNPVLCAIVAMAFTVPVFVPVYSSGSRLVLGLCRRLVGILPS